MVRTRGMAASGRSATPPPEVIPEAGYESDWAGASPQELDAPHAAPSSSAKVTTEEGERRDREQPPFCSTQAWPQGKVREHGTSASFELGEQQKRAKARLELALKQYNELFKEPGEVLVREVLGAGVLSTRQERDATLECAWRGDADEPQASRVRGEAVREESPRASETYAPGAYRPGASETNAPVQTTSPRASETYAPGAYRPGASETNAPVQTTSPRASEAYAPGCLVGRSVSGTYTQSRSLSDNMPALEAPANLGAAHRAADGERAAAAEPPAGGGEGQHRSGPDQALRDLASVLWEVARGDRSAAKRYQFDLPIFNGSSEDWLHFKSAYYESASSYMETENRARLRKCLKGAAMEAVKCLFLGSTAEQIMSRLEHRFGRPEALIVQELDRLRSLPKLTDTPRDVCMFACKVNNVILVVQALNKPHYLHSPEMVNIIVEKLTPIIKSRWYDYESERFNGEPALLLLGKFLDREAELNARHAKAEVIDDKPRRSYENKQRSYAASEGRCCVCEGTCVHVAICKQFKNMSSSERWEKARKYKLCFRCLRARRWRHNCKAKPCEISGCKYHHHRLLHGGVATPRPGRSGAAQAGASAGRESGGGSQRSPERRETLHDDQLPTAAVTSARVAHAQKRTLLKVVPVTVTGPRGETDAYALLDDGSTVTLATEDLARRVGAHGPRDPFFIEAVGGARINASHSQRIKLRVKGKYALNSVSIEARTIDKLDISAQSVTWHELRDCRHLDVLAEQLVYDDGRPSLLIGQDNWEVLLTSEVRRGQADQLVASQTPLGWVVHGQSNHLNRSKAIHTSLHRCGHLKTEVDSTLDQLVREHFDLDSLGVEPRRPKRDPEARALKVLEETTRALPEGGYETGLLWREDNPTLPNNYQAALGRLQGVEKRLHRDPELKGRYIAQINRMLKQGYAEKAPSAPSGSTVWYLPHFPVTNPAKPNKVRIVLDAAARTQGVCLNDQLVTGPALLQSLLGVLLRFRQRPIGIVADIKDMFLRIKIRLPDRDALRFLWRESADESPTEYRMTSLPFGATSSPTTAIYIKNLNATLHQEEFPAAASAIIRNHYMDDYLQSFDTPEEAATIARAVDAVHRKGNFELQTWTSNCRAAIAGFAEEESTAVPLDKDEKVLGLVWHPADDSLGFNLSKICPYSVTTYTKRELLRVTMSLYDPIGLVAPITTHAKRLLRSAWRLGLTWDEPLPKDLRAQWEKWFLLLEELKSMRIPRCHPGFHCAAVLELHTFVDASDSAYATCIYWRSQSNNGDITVSLAAAKGRVASLKVTSIPRLELQAAVVGSRLARFIGEEHDRRPDRRIFWCDSRTVLSWLRAGAPSFKPFVAHRIAELEETTSVAEWRWCPSALNVSDDCTRDAPPDFGATHRWFRGPSFLYETEAAWPIEEEPPHEAPTGEERTHAATRTTRLSLTHALPDITRFSSWLRLIRATARALLFIDLCRARTIGVTRKCTRRNPADDPTWKPIGSRTPYAQQGKTLKQTGSSAVTTRYRPLEAEYTRRAEYLWVRATQEESFAEEIEDINQGRAPAAHSRLRQLSLIIEDDTLRLRPRIAAASGLEREMVSPAVMDGKHRYCHLYIDWVHRQLHHSGVECVTNEIRQRYWIICVRPTVRSVIRKCQPCRLRRATPADPRTGDLPPQRLAHHHRAFSFVGLDYFGPLTVAVTRHQEKRYVALFTCLVSRAIHLEIANALTTDAAIMALRRMIARRGAPEGIWSDNATNFHGADAELRRAALSSLQQEAEVRCIPWYNIPPATPFWGGSWERMVATVKRALRMTLKERCPREDVLHTLLTEIEHTVNSRPLTHVSISAEDEEALTPNHFLLGGLSKVPLPGTFSKVDELGRSHWRASQRLADLFWQRWVREVLPVLQHRREPYGRGDPLKEGDLVLIVDSNQPRNVWPRGRVRRVYPGADGVVRVVDVVTKNGMILRRPTKRLVVLPVDVVEIK